MLKHRHLVAAVCLAALVCGAGIVSGQSIFPPRQGSLDLSVYRDEGINAPRYRSVDGCNWCTDLGNGLSGCTAMACIDSNIWVANRPPVQLAPPTWADADGKATLNWCIVQPAPADAERQITLALQEWAKYIQVTFERQGQQGQLPVLNGTSFDAPAPRVCDAMRDRTLTFSWVAADHGCGPLGALSPDVRAHAHWPAGMSVEPLAGDVHFWSGREWTASEIYVTALHEIGHVLGLRDSDDPGAVMSRYMFGRLWLQQSDIEAARRHYARRCFGVECAWGVR